MLVLITYDVNTQTAAGRKRLRKVAKECTNYGQRVQNSVFEINADSPKLTTLMDALSSIIDPETDSIRIYKLGKSYHADLKILGRRQSVEPSQDAIIDL